MNGNRDSQVEDEVNTESIDDLNGGRDFME